MSIGLLWYICIAAAFYAGCRWGGARERARRFLAEQRETNRRAQFGDRWQG